MRRHPSNDSVHGSAKAYYMSKARYSPVSRTSCHQDKEQSNAPAVHLLPTLTKDRPGLTKKSSKPGVGALPPVVASGTNKLPAPFQKRLSHYGTLGTVDIGMSSAVGPTYSSWKSSAIVNPTFTKSTVAASRTRTDWSAK